MDKVALTQVILPWYTPEGELKYSPMTMADPKGFVDRRKAFKIIRKWYREQIGVWLEKSTLQSIWRCRHTTYSMSEEMVAQKLHDMARATYEETENQPHTGIQEETS